MIAEAAWKAEIFISHKTGKIKKKIISIVWNNGNFLKS